MLLVALRRRELASCCTLGHVTAHARVRTHTHTAQRRCGSSRKNNTGACACVDVRLATLALGVLMETTGSKVAGEVRSGVYR